LEYNKSIEKQQIKTYRCREEIQMKKNIISKMISFIMSTAIIVTAASVDANTVNSSAEDYKFEYRNSLTSDSQMIYDGLEPLVDANEETVHVALPENIEISTSENTSGDLSDDQFAQVRIAEIINPGFQYFLLDHPEVFWIEGNPTFTYNYTVNADEASGEKVYSISDITFNFAVGESFNNDIQFVQQCKAELEDAFNNFSVEGETRYEKLKNIHDQLVQATSYDSFSNKMNYSAYGAFVNHNAACQGYSSAFKLLCEREGIPCVMVLLDNEHMWNYVQMEDGQWYVIDVTMDDYDFVEHIIGTGVKYDYFLKGVESMFSKNHIAPKTNHGVKNQLPQTSMSDYVCDPESPEFSTPVITPLVRSPKENADIDGDGVVSASDAIVCTSRILSYDSECDINNDGCTNSFDLITLKRIMKKEMSK